MRKHLGAFLLVLGCSLAVLAQAAPRVVASGELRSEIVPDGGGRVQTLQLNSRLMGRKMPFRVVLPVNYDDKAQNGRIYPVIYLLHGLTGHFENWTAKTHVTDYSVAYNFIIVTPEGGDGWYTDNVSVPNDKYESYIVNELIPEIDNRYRTIADRRGRIIAGLSMGGYGSLKFGLKYPDRFFLVGSFSGALGVASWTEKNIGKTIGGSIDKIFGPESSDLRRSNDIFEIVRGLTPEKTRSLPFVYQSCGTEDFLYENNKSFLQLLLEKRVPHEYREHPGGHEWVFWDDQIREFLSLADRMIRK